MQPGSRIETVLGLNFQAERIPLVAVRDAAEQYGAGVVPDQRPCRPAGQAVDRIAVGALLSLSQSYCRLT